MEETKEVKSIKVSYKCPKCDIGYLLPTGVCYPSYPPKYQHKCNECDNVEMLNNKYPYITYE